MDEATGNEETGHEAAGGLVLSLEHRLAAPPEDVFRMLTEPAELVKWWGPHGFTIPAADLNLAEGGSYRFRMAPPDGERFHVSGEFLEIDPPWRLVYTFRWDEPAPDDRDTVVDLSLQSAGTGTLVALSQGPFLTEERLALHRNGWTESFEKLQAVLDNGTAPAGPGTPRTLEAVLHDGTAIHVSVQGGDQSTARSVLLPVRVEPYPASDAETMRRWGADPELGPTLVAGLAGSYRVISADYEGHRMAHPAPDTLTPDNLAADLLAIADAAGADTFAYYGYSWLALAGLQLAIRTDRLWALAIGGYPPLDGPYQSMLSVTRSAHRMATEAAAQGGLADVDVPPSPGEVAGADVTGVDVAEVSAAAIDLSDVEPGDWDAFPVQTSEDQTQQFVTLYEALQGFDDSQVTLPPGLARLAFAGSADRIDYGPAWDNVQVEIGGPLAAHEDELTAAGWEVRVLPGLDHIGAMNSKVVLPLLQGWLESLPAPQRGVT